MPVAKLEQKRRPNSDFWKNDCINITKFRIFKFFLVQSTRLDKPEKTALADFFSISGPEKSFLISSLFLKSDAFMYFKKDVFPLSRWIFPTLIVLVSFIFLSGEISCNCFPSLRFVFLQARRVNTKMSSFPTTWASRSCQKGKAFPGKGIRVTHTFLRKPGFRIL